MSDQSRNRNEEKHGQGGAGKRLEKKASQSLSPQEARKQKERLIMIAMLVLAAVMSVAAAVVVLYSRWVKKPVLPPGPVQSGAPVESGQPADPSAEPTLGFDAVEPKVGGERKSEDIFTILIFGADVASGLTDTMMVATYDVTNQKATVMSLPRDTLINSSARPGIDAKKLNAVYNVYGQGERGVEALKAEVSELVGFTPDFYVRIDWELVGEMVDAIGGVWFDNPYHMEYYDPTQDLNIYQPQGYRKLSGADAMQVVRWRKNNPGVPTGGNSSGSDIDRLRVQHQFLKAVLEQTLQIQNLFRVGQLIDLFNSRVESDLDVEGMLWFAQSAVFGGLKVDDVEFCTMPNAIGSYGIGKHSRSFVYPIQSELLTLINEKLNPFVEQVTIRQLDLMSPVGDGSLRSSTGRLAEPSLGFPPVEETEEPEESDPLESDALESGQPVESDALESGRPEGGEPLESDPLESGQPAGSEPVESGAVPAQPDQTDPEPSGQPAQDSLPPEGGGSAADGAVDGT